MAFFGRQVEPAQGLTRILVATDTLTRQTAQTIVRIGITERAVQVILSDLTSSGYLNKKKEGRRNTYTVNRRGRLRHPLEAHHTVGELISALD